MEKKLTSKKKRKKKIQKKTSAKSRNNLFILFIFLIGLGLFIVFIPRVIRLYRPAPIRDKVGEEIIQPETKEDTIRPQTVKTIDKEAPADDFDYFKGTLYINGNIRKYFNKRSVSKDRVKEVFREKTENGRRFLYTTFSIDLNESVDLSKFTRDIIQIVKDNDGTVMDEYKYFINGNDVYTFYASIYDKVTHFFSISKKSLEDHGLSSPVIAIIIDDCGYSPPSHFEYLRYKENLTLSVLPHTPFIRETLEFAYENNNEIMLHLPLEPYNDSQKRDRGMIMVEHTAEEVKNIFLENLSFVPVAVGFNNHKGSKATSHKHTMITLMGIASKKGIYFIDSRTANNSIAYETAVKFNIPSIKRDVFLDNEDNEAYIINQFHNLYKIAYLRGYAVGICHMKLSTLKAMGKAFDEINALNIRVVPASYIIQNRELLARKEKSELPEKLMEMLRDIRED